MIGISRVESNEWFSMKDPENTRPTRANTYTSDSGEMKKTHIMNVPSCRLDVRKNFYNVRITKEWNSLPETTKNAKSTNEFEKPLRQTRDKSRSKQLTIDLWMW